MRMLFLLKEWIKHPKLRSCNSQIIDSVTTEELNDIVQSKIDSLLKHAVTTVPYYRELANKGIINRSNPRIEQFPILEKKDIRGHEELFVSDNYDINKLEVSRTSGSTGEPFKFYRNPIEFDSTYADLWRGLARVGIKHGDKRVLIKGIDEVPNPSLVILLGRWFYEFINQCILIDAHFLAREQSSVMKSLRRIRRYCPTYIHGYVSSIDILAAYAENVGYRMDDIGIKAVVTESEKLYDFQRERISRVFGCRVVENYGSVEFGMSAQPDVEDNLCINENHCYVETDIDNTAIYTNLDAYAFPFIRFKNGDIVSLRKQKKSVLPYKEIENVEGRVADTIRLPNGALLQGFIVMYPISKHMQYIIAYQIRQEKKDELQILLRIKKSLPKNIVLQIVKEMKDIVGQNIHVFVKVVEKIPVTKRGKHRFVYSTIKD